MTSESKACPFCTNPVSMNAIICSHCGHHFDVPEDDGSHSEYLMSVQKLSVPHRWLMIVACVILIIGSLLPWGMLESFLGTIEIVGMESDGVLSAGIGAVLLGVSFLSDKYSKNKRMMYIFGGIFSLMLLIPKMRTLLSPMYESRIYFGLVFAILGAALVLAAGILTSKKDVSV